MLTNTPYPQLASWPKLPEPEIVVTRDGGYRSQSLCVNAAILRAAGLNALTGIYACRFGDRYLLTADKSGELVPVSDRNSLMLRRAGQSQAMREGDYGFVVGPGYIVVTPSADAIELGGEKNQLQLKARSRLFTPGGRRGELAEAGVSARAALRAYATGRGRPESGQRLQKWPKLKAPVAVHVNVGMAALNVFRIPLRILRQAGLNVREGVNFATYENRALIWTDKKGGQIKLDSPDQQFCLAHDAIPNVTRHDFALVRGPGYVIVASKEEALALAPRAEVIEYRKMDKLTDEHVFESSRQYPLAADDILAWTDESHRADSTLDFAVAGVIWEIAGIRVGEHMRYFRYSNALFFEQCDANAGSRIMKSGKGCYPRHYVGTTLFPTERDTIRVIATKSGLVVTEVDSDIGKLCTNATKMPRRQLGALKRFVARHPAAKRGVGTTLASARTVAGLPTQVARLGKFTVETIGEQRVRGERNTAIYPINRDSSRIQVNGLWLQEYGFVPGARYSIAPHPLSPARRLVSLDPEGPYTVTTMSGDTPKLYVPLAAVAGFDSPEIKIFGTAEGLHVQRHRP